MTGPSTEPSREELRRQRREQMSTRYDEVQRTAESRAKMRRNVTIGAVVGVMLLIVGGLAFAVKEANAPLPGEVLADEGQAHVEVGSVINYNTYPPASGSHYPTPAPWQFFDQPVPPGYWVHNLEHGGIAVLYKCPADCEPLKNNLKALQKSLPTTKYGYPKVVMVPDDKIDGQLAVLAWRRREILPTYDENAIRKFYNAWVGRGPEDAG